MAEQRAEEQDIIATRALSIAAALAAADTGERAEARRMDEAGAPVFWRQVARLGIQPREEAAWLRFTRMVALLTPARAKSSIHAKDCSLGAVLADGGDAGADLKTSGMPVFSEQRLARLLASRGEARLDALERAIRMIARSQSSLNVISLARAVLDREGNELPRTYYARIDRTPVQEVDHA